VQFLKFMPIDRSLALQNAEHDSIVTGTAHTRTPTTSESSSAAAKGGDFDVSNATAGGGAQSDSMMSAIMARLDRLDSK
jgi:hypothetical protein